MDNDLSKLKAKPRVHFGSLEETDVVKRPRIEEPTSSTLAAGGIDLEALGKAESVLQPIAQWSNMKSI